MKKNDKKIAKITKKENENKKSSSILTWMSIILAVIIIIWCCMFSDEMSVSVNANAPVLSENEQIIDETTETTTTVALLSSTTTTTTKAVETTTSTTTTTTSTGVTTETTSTTVGTTTGTTSEITTTTTVCVLERKIDTVTDEYIIIEELVFEEAEIDLCEYEEEYLYDAEEETTTVSTTTAASATSTTKTSTTEEVTEEETTTTTEIIEEDYYEEEEYEEVSTLPITEDERILLCNLVGREYGQDYISTYEKAKVVAVVMNRVRAGSAAGFADTIYGVLTQPYQFSGYYVCYEYTWQVTDSVIEAVDYYFNHTDEFSSTILYFYGDGYYNYFY